MSICLTKADLKAICETSDREKQMQVLDAWGIPYEINPLTGNVKVLRTDMVWSAERSETRGPNYDAA